MNQRLQIISRVTTALVIAIALGVAWGAVAMWCGFIVTQFSSRPLVYEHIVVRLDGTPLIESQTYRNSMSLAETYRTLDGKAVDAKPRRYDDTWFNAPIQPPGLYETHLSWPERIAGTSDYQRPPVQWFAVRDDEVLGRLYFAGFDDESKSLVGYIGRNGFSRIVPAHDQWFEIGRPSLSWGNAAMASSSQISPAAKSYGRYQSVGLSQLPSWLVFVIDGDQLAEVNLRERSVRKVLDLPGIQQVVTTYELPKKVAKGDAPTNELADQGETNIQQQVDWTLNVAARNTDRIVMLDPRTMERREFKLNASLRDNRFNAYFLKSGEMLAVWTEKDHPPGETEVGWMRPDGEFSKQRTVQLAVQPSASAHTAAWLAAGVVPVTAGWLAVISVVAPLEMMQMHQAASYASGVAKLLPFTTLPLLAVIALSAFLAWQTAKLQRKYHRPATRVWATFVFLLGLPGFLAYLVEQRRPKMEACPQCNDIVPRDRSACASCNAEFLAPPRLGTEIFA